jgi:ribonuclease HII
MAYKATYRTRTYVRKGRVARTNPIPGLRHETTLRTGGAELIAGVDEVGVGAWAGPVVVGAVVLDPARRIYKIRDSKLLDGPRREWLSERIKLQCLDWSVGLSPPEEIDAEGLSEAIRRAARRALEGLRIKPDAMLLDGNWNFIGEGTKTVVRGDCESLSIAAASVVAKVWRDRLMGELASVYPLWGFESNKGYPSPGHKWSLAAYGPSAAHRRLFAPIRKLVDEGTPGRLLTTPGG